MAKSESDVLTDEPDHGMAACGFSLAYAAKRKIEASASRPRISSVRATGSRVSLAVIGLASLLAQERIEELFQNRPGNNAGGGGVTLAFVMNHKCGSGLHRNRAAQHDILDDGRIHCAARVGLRQRAVNPGDGRRSGAAIQNCLDALEIRGA